MEIVTDHDLRKDDLARLALERALYVIGEAANHLTPETRRSIEQPWHRIIGLRILLAHQYEAVEASRLQTIAQEHVPSLLNAVDAYLEGRLD